MSNPEENIIDEIKKDPKIKTIAQKSEKAKQTLLKSIKDVSFDSDDLSEESIKTKLGDPCEKLLTSFKQYQKASYNPSDDKALDKAFEQTAVKEGKKSKFSISKFKKVAKEAAKKAKERILKSKLNEEKVGSLIASTADLKKNISEVDRGGNLVPKLSSVVDSIENLEENTKKLRKSIKLSTKSGNELKRYLSSQEKELKDSKEKIEDIMEEKKAEEKTRAEESKKRAKMPCVYLCQIKITGFQKGNFKETTAPSTAKFEKNMYELSFANVDNDTKSKILKFTGVKKGDDFFNGLKKDNQNINFGPSEEYSQPGVYLLELNSLNAFIDSFRSKTKGIKLIKKTLGSGKSEILHDEN